MAEDSNASIGTRLTAGKDAVSDSLSENSHAASAEVNKQKVRSPRVTSSRVGRVS